MTLIKTTLFTGVTFVLFINLKAEEDATPNITDCYVCNLEGADTILRCTSINLGENETLNFSCISLHQKEHLTGLIIENSTIPTLNFTFIRENELSGLLEISVFDSNITNVVANIPCNITTLRLVNNSVRNFTSVLDDFVEGPPDEDDDRFETIDIDDEGRFTTASTRNFTKCTSGISLELENNLLEELPIEIIASGRLTNLQLSGNPLKCEFIWENVWDHLDCQRRPLECRNIFSDQNVTTCQFHRAKLFPSGIFHYNLTQIFDSKITLENECLVMNQTCECHPFNLLRDETGRPTVYLTVNCFGKNFTELPRVSPYTWELNVSNNNIQFLNTLNASMYRNLRRLDIRNNRVDTLNELTNTYFMKKFDVLYISGNKFQSVCHEITLLNIPDNFLAKAKASEGKGLLEIGSELECNCLTVTRTKGRLIEIQNNILDLQDIVCSNILQQPKPDENFANDTSTTASNSFLPVRDLKILDVCSINDSELNAYNWILAIITIEVFCIIGVILKVCYDWREYQRTGILPWIAQKLPRLPCDGILE